MALRTTMLLAGALTLLRLKRRPRNSGLTSKTAPPVAAKGGKWLPLASLILTCAAVENVKGWCQPRPQLRMTFQATGNWSRPGSLSRWNTSTVGAVSPSQRL